MDGEKYRKEWEQLSRMEDEIDALYELKSISGYLDKMIGRNDKDAEHLRRVAEFILEQWRDCYNEKMALEGALYHKIQVDLEK